MTAWAEIDLAALVTNTATVRERVAPAELMAVVKDDAYGHGLDEITRALAAESITAFGALDPQTALRVRQLAPEASVFAWLLDGHDELGVLIDNDIELGVTDSDTLERVARENRRSRVHLKIDTGLSRAGVRAERWPNLVERAAQLERRGAIEVVGVWTHISEASDDEDTASIGRFSTAFELAVAAGLNPRVRHLAASAASFARADARFDRVRVGAFLYGIAPGDGVGPTELGLRPVMTLRSTVLEAVDGVAAIGYGGVAGMLSDAAGAVSVAIGGVRHPVLAVEDSRTLIATGDHAVDVGDVATLFGSGDSGEATLQVWADAMGTIGEELVTRVHPGIERRYRG
ncbi:MAG: alanine racemase [Cryobacterium sp.]|nr:alanine racemase [Cryobacterium sp.]